MRRAWLRRAAVIALLSSACATADRGEATPAVTDSSGVRLVQNGEVGAWGADPARLTETLRIGVIDGEEPYQLSEVYALAVADDGTLFVGNNQTSSVRVFSATGEFVREIGRQGQGPGEYTMVNDVWLAGDRIVIIDWQLGGRAGVHTVEGELVHFWTGRRPDESRLTPVGFTPEGWVAHYDPPYRRVDVAPGEAFTRQRHLYRFDPEANDTVVRIIAMPTRTLYGSPQTEGLDWALFDPHLSFELDASGNMYVVRGETYRIDVHDATGRLIRGISRTWTPVPVRDEDISRLKEMIGTFYDTLSRRPLPERQAERDRVLERIDRQRGFNPRPHLPPLGRLLVSRDGSFWIERADITDPAQLEFERLFGGFGDDSPRPKRWDLFDAEGTYLASVELDPRFNPLAVRGTEVTGVYRDDLDVEYVVTYRATPG